MGVWLATHSTPEYCMGVQAWWMGVWTQDEACRVSQQTWQKQTLPPGWFHLRKGVEISNIKLIFLSNGFTDAAWVVPVSSCTSTAMYKYLPTRPPRSLGPSCLDRTCCMFRTTFSSPSSDSCDSQDTFTDRSHVTLMTCYMRVWGFSKPSWLSDHTAIQTIQPYLQQLKASYWSKAQKHCT